jgi:glycine/serine hydroxymethyltransferase
MPEVKSSDIWDYPNQTLMRKIEQVANRRCCELFGAAIADLRPLSGNNACNALLQGLCKSGDVIYSVSKECGGHFTTDVVCKKLGIIRKDIPYGADGRIDLSRFAEVLAAGPTPKLVFLDASMILFPYPVEGIRRLVGDEVIISYDASHTLGIIAGGQFQAPFKEGADIIQGSTHKSFFGPQKGIFLFRQESEASRAIQEEITPYFVSNSHPHHMAALGVAAEEMLKYGERYAKMVVDNTRTLAASLYKHGFDVLFPSEGFTRSHLFITKISDTQDPELLFSELQAVGIHVNLISVPFGSGKGFRIGCAEVSRRGFVPSDMEEMGDLVAALTFKRKSKNAVKQLVKELSLAHSGIEYCDQLEQQCLTRNFGLDIGEYREEASAAR